MESLNNITDYELTWINFWEKICLDSDERPDITQIKKELHDYKTLMTNVSEVYCEVTASQISKINTAPEHVIAAVNERLDEMYHEGYRDGNTFAWNKYE